LHNRIKEGISGLPEFPPKSILYGKANLNKIHAGEVPSTVYGRSNTSLFAL